MTKREQLLEQQRQLDIFYCGTNGADNVPSTQSLDSVTHRTALLGL